MLRGRSPSPVRSRRKVLGITVVFGTTGEFVAPLHNVVNILFACQTRGRMKSTQTFDFLLQVLFRLEDLETLEKRFVRRCCLPWLYGIGGYTACAGNMMMHSGAEKKDIPGIARLMWFIIYTCGPGSSCILRGILGLRVHLKRAHILHIPRLR